MEFSIRKNPKEEFNINILVDNQYIEKETSIKYLGLMIDENLKFDTHIENLCKKLSQTIFILRRLSKFCSEDVLLTAYYSLFLSRLRYAIPIWGMASPKSKQLFILQKYALRIIFKLKKHQSCKNIFQNYQLMTFYAIYIYET